MGLSSSLIAFSVYPILKISCKNAVTQDILSQPNLFSVVTNLYILSLRRTAFGTCADDGKNNSDERPERPILEKDHNKC